MFYSCGILNFTFSLYHLLNHALFKSILFLIIGIFIHCIYNTQDTRYCGGSVKLTPFIYPMFQTSVFSLGGLLFLSGFYSKDSILNVTDSIFLFSSFLSLYIVLTVAMITLGYALDLIYSISIKSPATPLSGIKRYLMLSPAMYIFLFIISFCSVCAGYLLLFIVRWLFISHAENNVPLINYNFFSLNYINFSYRVSKVTLFNWIPITCSFLASLILNNSTTKTTKLQASSLLLHQHNIILLYVLFNKKCLMDFYISKFIVFSYFSTVAAYVFKYVDKGITEQLMVQSSLKLNHCVL